MPARFRILEAFDLPDRGLWVAAGTVEDGNPQTGMSARFEDDDDPSFAEPVHGVELVDPPGDESADAYPALTFHYRDDDKLEAYRSLAWEGRTLLLEW